MTAFLFRHRLSGIVAAVVFVGIGQIHIVAEEPAYWPQFRGPQSSGVAAADDNPPVELSVERELLWKKPVPYGHGSPCIWANKIFLTGFDREQKKLQVLCLDRTSGEIFWMRDVEASQIERVHEVSSPATATVATDGERIYVYFGSVGLLCYDLEGELQWACRLPIPRTQMGSGTSPIVAGELVVLNRDAESDPYLLAVNRRTGAEVWKQPLHVASIYGMMSCATPVIWRDEIVLHRTGEVAAFKLSNGERTWSCSMPSTGNSTPVVGDETLFLNAWNNFGEPELRVELPGFGELLKKHDANGDKKLSKQEFPKDLALSKRPEVGGDVPGAQMFLQPMFDRFDPNQDGQLTGFEWVAVRVMLTATSSEHGLFAVTAGENGDATKSSVRWKHTRAVAEVPSPLYYEGRVYMVKDGGIVTCLDAASGELVYRERLGAPGAYHSSPVLAADRIYIASTHGVITTFAAGDSPQILAKSDLGEPIRATPAILDDSFYVRTHEHMFVFRRK